MQQGILKLFCLSVSLRTSYSNLVSGYCFGQISCKWYGIDAIRNRFSRVGFISKKNGQVRLRLPLSIIPLLEVPFANYRLTSHLGFKMDRKQLLISVLFSWNLTMLRHTQLFSDTPYVGGANFFALHMRAEWGWRIVVHMYIHCCALNSVVISSAL